MDQKNIFTPKNYIRICFGLCISIFLTGLLLTKSFDPDYIFPQGEMADFPDSDLKSSENGFCYQDGEGCFLLNANHVSKKFPSVRGEKEYHYILLKISHLQSEEMNVTLHYRDHSGNYRGYQEISLKNGENWVCVTAPEFRYFNMDIDGAKGDTIAFEDIKVWENEPLAKKKIVLLAVPIFILYLDFTSLFSQKLNLLIGCLQKGYGFLRDSLYYIYHREEKLLRGIFRGIPAPTGRNRRILPTVSFLILLLSMCFANITSFYTKTEYYKYFMAVSALCVWIAVGRGESKPPQTGARTSSPQAVCLEVFAISMCISDFVWSKFYKFTGYVLLFVFCFFHRRFSHRLEREEIYRDFVRSMEILFWPGILLWIISHWTNRDVSFLESVLPTQGIFLFTAMMLFFFLSGYFCYRKKQAPPLRLLYFFAGTLICICLLLSLIFNGKLWETLGNWDLAVSYLRETNWLGHRTRQIPYLIEKRDPGNHFLQILYRYGIFTAAAYLALLYSMGHKAISQLKRKDTSHMKLFETFCILLFLTAGMFVDVEYPFLHPVWVMFYLAAVL